jgi:hypothetical protein
MPLHDPLGVRPRVTATPPRSSTGAAPVAASAHEPSRSRGRRIRGAATAGTEIVIAVLVALVFFVGFMLAMSVLMPSGLTFDEVVKPTADSDGNADGRFSASLEGLGNLGERLNPAAAVLTVFNSTVLRKAAYDIAWGPVGTGAALRDGDAVQTTRDGTAMLTFSRGRRLQLEQNSLVIVRANRDSIEVNHSTPSVRVLVGELWGRVGRDGDQLAAVDVTSPGIETRVSPSAGANSATFRVAVRDDKTTVLSVYRGSADVMSRGRRLRVGANQFVAVDSVRGIAPPAPLPLAPALVAPDGGASFSYRELVPQVHFRWNPVPDVDSYRLIVSRSPEFQGVVIDQRLSGTSFTYGNFASGAYYWRVSALRGGAEGPPSAPRAVVVSNVQRAPGLSVEFPPAAVYADHCTIRGTGDPGIRIVVAGERVVLDPEGRFERVVALKRGFNVVVVEAIDRVGNTTYKSKVVEAKY